MPHHHIGLGVTPESGVSRVDNSGLTHQRQANELRRWSQAVLIIACLAFAIRIAVMWHRTPMNPSGDEPEYIGLAHQLSQTGHFRITQPYQSLFEGGRSGDPTAFRSPVLPAFLAIHYRLFGFSETPPRVTMALLGVLACVLIAILGRQLLSPLAGLIAAACWAFWPPAILSPYAADRFTPEHLGTTVLLAHLVALAAVLHKPTTARIAVAGGLLGLAILTRGYFLLTFPLEVLFVWLLPVPNRTRLAALFAGVTCLVVGVWVLRNWHEVGKPVLSTQTEGFYVGNNQWARGSLNGDFFTTGAKAPQLQVIIRKYPHMAQMNEAQRSRMWLNEGIHVVVSQPKHTLWLLVRKTLIFLGPFLYWTAGPYNRHYFFMLALILMPFGILAALRQNRKRELVLLLLPLLGIYIATLMTYALDRYRYPAEPGVLLLACFGALELWQRLRGGQGGAEPQIATLTT